MDGPLLGYFFCRLVFMVVFGEFAVVTALLNGHQRRWKVSGLSRAIPRRSEKTRLAMCRPVSHIGKLGILGHADEQRHHGQDRAGNVALEIGTAGRGE